MWIANRWTGINVFDCETKTFSSFRHNKNDNGSLVSDKVNDILITSTGDAWIATDKGLDLYDSHAAQFIHYNTLTVPGFPSNEINTLTAGSNGEIYIGHGCEGFSIFTPKDKKIKSFKHLPDNPNSLPSDIIHSISVGTGSNIWIATRGGLSLFDQSTEIFRNFKETKGLHSTIQESTYCVYQTKGGRIWVGTISDLCYFDEKDTDKILSGEKDVDHMFIQDINWGISNPTVLCLHEDSFGNIWIGSNGGGASLISSTSSFFQSWKINKIPGVVNGLNDKEVLTICIDEHQNIWMGTDGGGINVNKNGKNCEFHTKENGSISSIVYYSSLKDSNNNLWFGDGTLGIDIFNSKEKRFTRYKPKGSLSPVYCLFEDNCRNVWIGSDNGLEIYNLDTKEKVFINQQNSDLQTNAIKAVSQDSNGKIWIGTLNKGITVYDPIGENMKHLYGETIFYNNEVNQIFRDSKNRMWVALTEGLILFPDNQSDKYELFNSDNGLACNRICAMEEDSQGNIWVSTNSGISCFIEAEKRFLNYNHNDGALFGTYMPNSVAKTKDGTIYFGSINGVCYFNPIDKPVNVVLPPVIFTEFEVHKKNSHEDAVDVSLPMVKNKVSLKHDQNIFSVSFNVMDKSLQGKVEYAYNLDGLTDTWISTNGDNQVTFRNIPHHNYMLHIKARYKNQPWPENYSTLAITVNPPLWLTWWAKLLYFVCFMVLTFLLVQAYKRRLQLRNSLILEKEKAQKQQELNEERLRFYTNITHELRTPLTLILGPLEDLQNDSKIQQEHRKQLSLIHKSAIRLLNLVTRILEFRKTETRNKRLQIIKADISERIQEIGLKYKELNRKGNIRFDIVIDTHNTQLYFDLEVIMIVDNLLSNAFKYTCSGGVKLILRSVSANDVDYTEIEVCDTGIGIPGEELSFIFERYYQVNKRKNSPGFGIGLALVKNLVDLHEGLILVDSQINVGSSFRVRLVTNNTYPDAIHIQSAFEENVEIGEEKTTQPLWIENP